MRSPTPRAIATYLAEIRDEILQPCSCGDVCDPDYCAETTDVRLQVYPSGDWAVRYGQPDYDLDHRGFWGALSVALSDDDIALLEIARDLVEQAEEQHAMGGDE